jgi:hypothetical protein
MSGSSAATARPTTDCASVEIWAASDASSSSAPSAAVAGAAARARWPGPRCLRLRLAAAARSASSSSLLLGSCCAGVEPAAGRFAAM